jgi:hypothetical protein
MLEELLDNLIKRYPNRLPSKEINSYSLGVLIGNQDVIKYIASYIEARKNNSK